MKSDFPRSVPIDEVHCYTAEEKIGCVDKMAIDPVKSPECFSSYC